MRTILRMLLAVLAVPLLILIGMVAIVLNAIALVANLVTAIVLLLFWRRGNWMVGWPVHHAKLSRAGRASSFNYASVHG